MGPKSIRITVICFAIVGIAAAFQNCAVGGESGALQLGSSSSAGGTGSGDTTTGATTGATTGVTTTRCAQAGGYISNGRCFNNNEECMNAAAVGGPYTFPQSVSWVQAAQVAGMTGCTAEESSAKICTNCCTDTDFYPAGTNNLDKMRAYCTGNIN